MPLKDKEKRREYHRKYMKDVWYPKNRTKHIRYVKDLKNRLSDYVINYKKERFCIDCGFPGYKCPQVLDFDHMKDKKFDISQHSLHILSLDKLKIEIEKCELVCANCHRIRTMNRRRNKSI